MANTPQSSTSVSQGAIKENNSRPTGKHVHHGRTLAAWVGVTIAMVAFILGGIAMVMSPINWTLFWIAAGLLVVALVAARVLQLTGHGAN
jgi:hypothetical protein